MLAASATPARERAQDLLNIVRERRALDGPLIVDAPQRFDLVAGEHLEVGDDMARDQHRQEPIVLPGSQIDRLAALFEGLGQA